MRKPTLLSPGVDKRITFMHAHSNMLGIYGLSHSLPLIFDVTPQFNDVYMGYKVLIDLTHRAYHKSSFEDALYYILLSIRHCFEDMPGTDAKETLLNKLFSENNMLSWELDPGKVQVILERAFDK